MGLDYPLFSILPRMFFLLSPGSLVLDLPFFLSSIFLFISLPFISSAHGKPGGEERPIPKEDLYFRFSFSAQNVDEKTSFMAQVFLTSTRDGVGGWRYGLASA